MNAPYAVELIDNLVPLGRLGAVIRRNGVDSELDALIHDLLQCVFVHAFMCVCVKKSVRGQGMD